MSARRVLLFVLVAAGAVGACNEALTVLETNASSRDGGDEGGAEAGAEGGPSDAGASDADASDDGWPGPPGTVVPIASGLAGAVDIDVDDAFVYVLVGGQDGGLVRVPKRGGAVAAIAPHQIFPTAVRATPAAIVWTVAPGQAPQAPSVMTLPRDGGAPVPLVVGAANAGQLAADGNRVAWVDGNGGAAGRVVIAELDKGSVRPVVENELGVGGFAIEGDTLVWTARCNANQCGGWVMTSPIGAPSATSAWSTTSNTEMRGVALASGTIAFAYSTLQGPFFGRLPPGSSNPVQYAGNQDVASPIRRDGDAVVLLARSGSSLALTRARVDGTTPPAPVTTTPGTRGAVAPDGPAIYWISNEEGVLRAIAR